ncbi:MAG: restriction endonuclease subunit R, partial [Cyanobacteria bacterium P01_A01_bin.135]
MVQAMPASQITLPELQERFGLVRSDDEQFFCEWQRDLPELTPTEEQAVAEVKAEYRHLSQYSMLEPMVKMVVLSPLLKLATFFQPPFYLAAEKEVAVTSEDEGIVIRGRIDLLAFSPPFWVTVIESKQVAYSVETAIPQALAYMLGSPNGDR